MTPCVHPELSFAIRHYGAAGINITASHNPKDYNGYKVYWSDGAQLPRSMPPQSPGQWGDGHFSGVSTMDFDEAVEKGLVRFIGAETDEAFLEKVLSQSIDRDVVARVADRFKIVYTPSTVPATNWFLRPSGGWV